jgi:hypothetical protein
MEKEFIPYEQALALKELGFDEPCFGWYSNMDGNVFRQGYCETYLGIENCAKAPLYQQAFRWFRDKHNLYHQVHKGYGWEGTIRESNNKEYILWHDGTYNSYEEAELECLKKLIEIVKEEKFRD